jgi:hypothetical protein
MTTVLLLVALVATAQDFQKTYSVGPGALVSVKNVSGDIAVVGYEGRDVLAVAFKEGPDRDLVQIEDQSTADGIALQARYPQDTRCNASVRFELRVPQNLDLNFDSLSSASGNISVRAVRGTLRAKTASGNVDVEQADGTVDASTASGNVTVQRVAGLVSARTASGDVEVELVEQLSGKEMKFSSASGNVTVKAPSNLDAEVQMSTASGSLRTNFPLTIEDRESGSGQKAHGRLGSGSCLLKLSTASGNVRLTH